MTYSIKGLDADALMTLDDILPGSWREESKRRDDGNYDVDLNDAWLKIFDDIIYICMDNEEQILFRSLFIEIVIH